MKQYPYKLETLTLTEPGQDSQGNNIPPVPSWHEHCSCRDEAGNGRLIQAVDGTAITYSFLVQMPQGTAAIEAGTTIRVKDGPVTRCQGKVIYSRKDQFHSRAWV